MPRTLLSGLLAGAAGFVLVAAFAGLVDFLGPIVALLVGGAAGYAAAARGAAPRRRDGGSAGAIAGLLTAAGQLVGAGVFLVILYTQQRPFLFPLYPAAEAYPLLTILGGSLLLGGMDTALAAAAGALAVRFARPAHALHQARERLLAQPRVDHPLWRKDPQRIPLQRFSSGAREPFSWYFDGESKVPVSSVSDIVAWLRECEYVRDNDLFMRNDFWQHPVTFEQIRKGDCEDHALWAWRKLVELGLEAELVVGRTLESDGRHAWVMYVAEGELFGFEATRKKSNPILTPVEATRLFRPEYGVDSRFQTYRYTGAAADAKGGDVDGSARS